MFENPRRGRQARNFTTNVPKILGLKSSSEQIFSENCRWVPLIFRLYIGMRIYMNLKVYILPPLNIIFCQAMLKIVVYQMLIVTNVPVNSAAL